MGGMAIPVPSLSLMATTRPPSVAAMVNPPAKKGQGHGKLGGWN